MLSLLLFFNAYNLGRLPLAESSLYLSPLPAVILLLQLAILRSRQSRKIAVVLTMFIVYFFSYGQVFDVAMDWGLLPFAVRQGILLTVWTLAFVLGVRAVIRTRSDLANLTRILNLVGAVLTVMPVGQIAWHGLNGGIVWNWSRPTENPVPVTGREGNPGPRPDIYYIILDRYGNEETLRQSYDHDNRGFLEFLRQKGFYVAGESHSNYLRTPTSLACSLSFEYLDHFTQDPGRQSADILAAYSRLQDYRVWRFLKARGYKFIHLGTRWEPTRRNPYADVNVNYWTPPQVIWALSQQTLLRPLGLALGIAPLDQRTLEHRRIPYQFARLAEIAADPAPTFTFAHFLIPHQPYNFEPDGSFVPEDVMRRRTRKENYRNQVLYVNGKVRETIERLLAASPTPPVILLQGDEGPIPIRYPREGHDYNWREATAEDFREKTGILNAYYLPGVSQEGLYPSISPVNSFRLIFNLYFRTDFPLLPDEYYAPTHDDRPYDFYSITDQIRPKSASKKQREENCGPDSPALTRDRRKARCARAGSGDGKRGFVPVGRERRRPRRVPQE
jgi:hypothetical protein